ncbi:PepSY-like domain-containing protein [Tamlana crocina]
MKTFKVLLGAFLVTILFAFASGGDKAPQKVKNAFAKKFPAAKKVKWEKENATEWEAEFKINKVKYCANFFEDGTWTETEHEIDEKDIPQNVKATLTSSFPGYEMEEAEISETHDGSIYEFEIEKGEAEMEVAIDKNGKIVNQEVKKEDKD